MADIEIAVAHGGDAARAKTVVEQALGRMAAKMGLEATWRDEGHLELSGKGIKRAEVRIDADRIAVTVDLALMAKPMKGMIAEKIEEGLRQALA